MEPGSLTSSRKCDRRLADENGPQWCSAQGLGLQDGGKKVPGPLRLSVSHAVVRGREVSWLMAHHPRMLPNLPKQTTEPDPIRLTTDYSGWDIKSYVVK